jgi:hypothetical protein
MEIENATFGTITIDGKTYEHDVVIRLSGEVVKRKKKLSKKYYGTSHMLSKDEAKFVFEKGCNQLIVGSGQMGNVRLSPEAEAYFAKKDCKVLLQPTPDAIQVFNKPRSKKIGLCGSRFGWPASKTLEVAQESPDAHPYSLPPSEPWTPARNSLSRTER